jgi:hypothetical protein
MSEQEGLGPVNVGQVGVPGIIGTADMQKPRPIRQKPAFRYNRMRVFF